VNLALDIGSGVPRIEVGDVFRVWQGGGREEEDDGTVWWVKQGLSEENCSAFFHSLPGSLE